MLTVGGFPQGLGVDAGGIVVEMGEGVDNLKAGDVVCGCTRLGSRGYNTGQEFVSFAPFPALHWASNVLIHPTVFDGCTGYHSKAEELYAAAGLHVGCERGGMYERLYQLTRQRWRPPSMLIVVVY